MEMNNKLKLITYNCKHFVCGGHKFDFLNSLFCETDFLFLSDDNVTCECVYAL